MASYLTITALDYAVDHDSKPPKQHLMTIAENMSLFM